MNTANKKALGQLEKCDDAQLKEAKDMMEILQLNIVEWTDKKAL